MAIVPFERVIDSMTTEQQERKVKIGFIGAGFIGQVAHLANYKEIPGAEVVALAELRPELGELVCRRYDIPRYYESHCVYVRVFQ